VPLFCVLDALAPNPPPVAAAPKPPDVLPKADVVCAAPPEPKMLPPVAAGVLPKPVWPKRPPLALPLPKPVDVLLFVDAPKPPPNDVPDAAAPPPKRLPPVEPNGFEPKLVCVLVLAPNPPVARES
jgi:hypothetical protein